MSSKPTRHQVKDHLLTPQKSALIIRGYQPLKVNSIVSMDRQLLANHRVGVASAASALIRFFGFLFSKCIWCEQVTKSICPTAHSIVN